MSGDKLSATFAALADPTRRAILIRLTKGEATVQELADPLPMSQPAVSKHLKVLEKAGLVERRRVEQSRPVRLRADPFKEVAKFADDFGQFWDESFERLDELLEEEKAKGKKARARRREK